MEVVGWGIMYTCIVGIPEYPRAVCLGVEFCVGKGGGDEVSICCVTDARRVGGGGADIRTYVRLPGGGGGGLWF